jgi:hypothetical protein
LTPSFRAEVATKVFSPIQSTKWYSFSIFLPADFPIEDNRLVFAQWHGVNMEDYGQPARIPVLAFRYRAGHFSVTLRHSAEQVIQYPDAVPSQKLFDAADFSRNCWHDFVIQARWSYKDDGFINIWWNGRQIVQYRGPVGYNESTGPQFKFGLYRDDTVRTYVAYFNHVKFGTSPEEVDFNPKSLPSRPTPAE